MLAFMLLALQYVERPLAGYAPRKAAREEAIWKDLRSQSTPDWAGPYTDNLMLSPQAGFMRSTPSCMGPSLTHGDVIVKGRQIKFVYSDWGSEHEEVWWSIPWGDRRYLIRDDRVPEFCVLVNSEIEPRTGDDWPQVRIGDLGRQVSGLPDVPAAFEHLLLCDPVDGRVLRVSQGPDPDVPWKKAAMRVWLRLGSRVGIQPEHCFHFAKPWGRPIRGYVSEVDQDTCVVEITGTERWNCDGPRAGDLASTSPQRLLHPLFRSTPSQHTISGECSLDMSR